VFHKAWRSSSEPSLDGWKKQKLETENADNSYCDKGGLKDVGYKYLQNMSSLRVHMMRTDRLIPIPLMSMLI
jgi:hypothetical protein